MTITIIGGGIIGLTTAFELTERGESVHLIDAETSDYGTADDGTAIYPAASHYAGGMLAPIAEVQFQQDALFPLMTASADAYPSLMGRLSRATDLPTGYDTTGTLIIAADRADAEHLQRTRAYYRDMNRPADAVTPTQARALELLDVVGLDSSYAKRYPSQLSGGQVQRVGVARALAADAPVLLMDEPFSAVDPVVRTDLQKELLRLQGQLAKTIVFVTHDIDEALLLGDTIAVFAEGGRLAQFGTPEEILYSPADDFVRSFVSRSVAGLLDEQTVRQARARRLAASREAQNGALEGEKSE